METLIDIYNNKKKNGNEKNYSINYASFSDFRYCCGTRFR